MLHKATDLSNQIDRYHKITQKDKLNSLRTANAQSSLGFAKVVRNRYPIVFEMDAGNSSDKNGRTDNLTSLMRSNNYQLPALSGRVDSKRNEKYVLQTSNSHSQSTADLYSKSSAFMPQHHQMYVTPHSLENFRPSEQLDDPISIM